MSERLERMAQRNLLALVVMEAFLETAKAKSAPQSPQVAAMNAASDAIADCGEVLFKALLQKRANRFLDVESVYGRKADKHLQKAVHELGSAIDQASEAGMTGDMEATGACVAALEILTAKEQTS